MSGRARLNSKFLIDTNILIYYFNGIELNEKIDNILLTSFNISIITKIEFLSWQKLYQDKSLEEKAIAFLSNARVYDLDDNIADKVIKIRQRHKVKTPDAIIGATAQVNGLGIVTNNEKDFQYFDLKVVAL